MLKFAPEELREKFIEAMKYIEYEFGASWEIDEWSDLTNEDFDPNDYDEQELSEDSEIYMSFEEHEDYITVSIKEFIDLVEEVKTASFVNDYICITKERCLIRVNTYDYSRRKYIRDHENMDVISEINGKNIRVSLVEGFSIFGIMVLKNGDYNEYNPPILDDDLFIEISIDTALKLEDIEDIVNAYIFELSTSLKLELFIEARPNSVYDDADDDSEYEAKKLRPLMYGKGIKELLSLYNKSIEVGDSDYQILNYVKVIEYVSQTVIRQEINNSVQIRLASPKALNPDATFIMELEALFDEQKVYTRDREAIKLTIEHCCDVIELSKIAPIFLKKLNQVTHHTKKETKKEALLRLATCIVDTRNFIAHAKSNYKPTGNECPHSEIHQFTSCVQLVAQQVIRWFGQQNENNRII